MSPRPEQEGIKKAKLLRKPGLKVWALAGDEIVRFFLPHPVRRPWGFVFHGYIGIEIPALRDWLKKHKPGPLVGIFHTNFTSYYTMNEDVLRELTVEHGASVPAKQWASLIKKRLERIPNFSKNW